MVGRRWQRGDQITMRYVGHAHRRVRGRPGVLQGWPYVVVEDTADILALWMPVGTRMKRVDMADRSTPLEDHIHGKHRDKFRRGECMRLMLPGKPYSIWLHWSAGAPRRFTVWYINLEAPFIRTDIGVDTTDNSVDLVVMPDLTWRWKDVEMASEWIAVGVFNQAQTDGFFEDGNEAIEMAQQRRFPFDGSLSDWVPDPECAIPAVHPHWADIPGYDLNLTTGNRLNIASLNREQQAHGP
jgi:hypothetical protein